MGDKSGISPRKYARMVAETSLRRAMCSLCARVAFAAFTRSSCDRSLLVLCRLPCLRCGFPWGICGPDRARRSARCRAATTMESAWLRAERFNGIWSVQFNQKINGWQHVFHDGISIAPDHIKAGHVRACHLKPTIELDHIKPYRHLTLALRPGLDSRSRYCSTEPVPWKHSSTACRRTGPRANRGKSASLHPAPCAPLLHAVTSGSVHAQISAVATRHI
jgi:hypothetical protein